MTYRQDLSNSARRHLRAAEELHAMSSSGSQPGCKTVAGYLFGLSGELAVKAMMRKSGMKPMAADKRRDDPFYAHFPELKTRLLNSELSRRSSELLKIAGNRRLFEHWDTSMRYAPAEDIRAVWIDSWLDSARDLVSRMDFY